MSSSTGCQFTENYSWYNFLPTDSQTTENLYTSTNLKKTYTAYFTYCQGLDLVSGPACGGSNYATIVT